MNIVVTDRLVCDRKRRRISARWFAKKIVSDHSQYGVLSAIGDYDVIIYLRATTGVCWPISQSEIIGRADRIYIVHPTESGFDHYICDDCKVWEALKRQAPAVAGARALLQEAKRWTS